MALSKKGSRKIVVSDSTFRWVLSPAARGTIVLTVQSAEGSGQLLRVSIPQTPLTTETAGSQRSIAPSDVAAIIANAMQCGWKPDQNGAPLVCKLVGSTLCPKGEDGSH